MDEVGDIAVNTIAYEWEENEWIAQRNFSNLMQDERHILPPQRTTKAKAEKKFKDLRRIFHPKRQYFAKPAKPRPNPPVTQQKQHATASSQYIGVYPVSAMQKEW